MNESEAHQRKVTETLTKLGISEQDSQIYVEILRQQPGECTGLSLGETPVLKNAYETVRKLQDMGIVSVGLDAFGKSVVRPIDPRIVSRAIYARFLWSLCPSEAMIGDLSTEERTRLKEYRELCGMLEEELGNLYTHPCTREGIVMIQEEQISVELAICLGRVEQIIRGVTAPTWVPDISLVWETIKDRIAEGIVYRRLGDPLTFVSFGHAINRRDVEQIGVKLRLLPQKQLKDKFFIVDTTEAFIFWPPGPGRYFPLEASRTTFNDMILNCCESFDRLWKIAVPAEKIFPYMERLREQFVERCVSCTGTEETRHLAEGVFDYGKFFLREHLALEDASYDSALKSLRDAGLVCVTPDGSGTTIPNLSKEIGFKINELMNSV